MPPRKTNPSTFHFFVFKADLKTFNKSLRTFIVLEHCLEKNEKLSNISSPVKLQQNWMGLLLSRLKIANIVS